MRGIGQPQSVVILYCGKALGENRKDVVELGKLLNVKLWYLAFCGKGKLGALIADVLYLAHSFKGGCVLHWELHRIGLVHHDERGYLGKRILVKCDALKGGNHH